MRTVVCYLLIAVSLVSCGYFEGIESKQTTACIDDVKLGLNDPNSIELISSKVIELDNGWRRVEVHYTAKNAMGGRVRGKDICGFATKSDIEINPKDFMNETRKLARDLRSLGIDIK